MMTRRLAILPEAFLLLCVVFGPLAFGAVEPWSIRILEALMYCAAAATMLTHLAKRERFANLSLPFVATVLITALGVAQAANSRPLTDPSTTLGPFTASAQATSNASLLWGAYAALLFSALSVYRDAAARRRLLWTIFALGVIVALIGLMQKGQGNLAYYGLRPIRRGNPFGPYTNKNHAASFLLFSIFAGAGLWLSRLNTIASIEQMDHAIDAWTKQAIFGFFIVLELYALAVIRCRGAIHAGLAASVLLALGYAWTLRSTRARQTIFGVVAAAILAFAALIAHDPSWIGREKKEAAAPYRLNLYRNSLQIAGDFPIFGTGLGTYEAVFSSYQDRTLFDGSFDHAHNDWIELLLQTGAFGALAFTAALLRSLWTSSRAWLHAATHSRWLHGTFLAAVIAFMLHGMVEFSFQIPANAAIFFIWVSVLAGETNVARS